MCLRFSRGTPLMYWQESLGQISFTADGWSDGRRRTFLAITSHWCGRNSNGRISMRDALLAFHHVTGSHDGEHLAEITHKMLDRANIVERVC